MACIRSGLACCDISKQPLSCIPTAPPVLQRPQWQLHNMCPNCCQPWRDRMQAMRANRGDKAAVQQETKKQAPSAPPTTSKPQQSPQDKLQQTSQSLLSRLLQFWEQLDTQQRAFTVVAGLVLLVALPQVVTLLVLLLERALIGALLVAEELLVELLFKGGALLGVLGLVGLVGWGVYTFTQKATK